MHFYKTVGVKNIRRRRVVTKIKKKDGGELWN